MAGSHLTVASSPDLSPKREEKPFLVPAAVEIAVLSFTTC